jgi:iron complex transport system substrate-binding protein
MRPALAALALILPGAALADPVTIDNCGRTLTFDSVPSRAVVHDINMAEIMFALELQPRMVGITGITGWYKTTPEFEAARGGIPELAPKYPTMENLVAVEPDFFFAGWYYGMQPGGAVTPETLAAFDIQTYVLTESCAHVQDELPGVSMETLYGDVRAIAAIFRVESRAAALIEEWTARIAAVEVASDGTAPRRVFLYDSGEDQPFTAGRHAMPTALIEAAGGRNVMDDIEMSWGRVGWEAVGERDPELIIVLDYDGNGGQTNIDFLEAHPVMAETTAVREGRYVALKYSEVTPGPANINAIERIAAAMRANGT